MQAQRIEAAHACLAFARSRPCRCLPRARGDAGNGADARPRRRRLDTSSSATSPTRVRSRSRTRRASPPATRSTLCQQVVDAHQDANWASPQLTVQWVPVTVDNRLRDVQQGDVDLLCTPTQRDAGAAARRSSFSIPVFAGGIRAVRARGRAAGAARRRCRQARAAHSRLARLAGGQGAREARRSRWSRARRRRRGSRAGAGVLQVDAATSSRFRTIAPGMQTLQDGKVDVFFGERSLMLGGNGRMRRARTSRSSIASSRSEPLALALAQGRRRLPRCSSIAH